MDDVADPSPEPEGEVEDKKSGCFYTLNTLMILFGLIPVVVGIILFLLWLIFQ